MSQLPQRSEQPILLEMPEGKAAPTGAQPSGGPKLRPINRAQKTWAPLDVEELIGAGHKARREAVGSCLTYNVMRWVRLVWRRSLGMAAV